MAKAEEGGGRGHRCAGIRKPDKKCFRCLKTFSHPSFLIVYKPVTFSGPQLSD